MLRRAGLAALVLCSACDLAPFAAPAETDAMPGSAIDPGPPTLTIESHDAGRLASWSEHPPPLGDVEDCRAYLGTGEILLWSANRGRCQPQRFDGERWSPISDDGAPDELEHWWAEMAAGQLVVYGYAGGRHRAHRYDLEHDRWSDTVTFVMGQQPHEVRALAAGDRLLLWGGYDETATGTAMPRFAKYDPPTDTWFAMSLSGMPAPRYRHGAVWDSHHMFVFGGLDYAGALLGDAALYDEASDSWELVVGGRAPTARTDPAIAWTGHEYVVVGGRDAEGQALADGAAYCPAPCWAWQAISPTQAAFAGEAPVEPQAFWTGEHVIVVQTEGPARMGRYDLESDRWAPIELPVAFDDLEVVAARWDWDRYALWLWGRRAGSSSLLAYYPPYILDPAEGHPGEDLSGNQRKP